MKNSKGWASKETKLDKSNTMESILSNYETCFLCYHDSELNRVDCREIRLKTKGNLWEI